MAFTLLSTGGAIRAETADTVTPIVAPEPATAMVPEGPSPETLPLAQDPTQRLTLPVMVNGQGPFDFLVDTGSDRTVISRELAAKLGLAPGPRVMIHESGGADKVGTVVIDRLKVGKRVINHIEAPALDAHNLGAEGMLGVDALRDLHLIMDFKAMQLSSTPSRAEPLDDHTIVVEGRSRFGQLILANSKIRGVTVLVVLDSGSQLSVGNPALLKLLTGRRPDKQAHKTTTIVTVTGRRVEVELDDIAETNVGGITIRNMPLAFAELHIFERFGLTRQPAMLLGMDVLSLCRKVTVDLRRREATFTLD
jgi:predicted aspartyl protease